VKPPAPSRRGKESTADFDVDVGSGYRRGVTSSADLEDQIDLEALEGEIRAFCAASLDPLVGAGRFGYGIHFSLGAALARMKGRIALDEVLQRGSEWDVDWDNAKQAHTAHGRGWERPPVTTGRA
jgi:hypothetical protein